MSWLIFALFTVLTAAVMGIKAREIWHGAGLVAATTYRQEIVSCQGTTPPCEHGDGEEAARAVK